VLAREIQREAEFLRKMREIICVFLLFFVLFEAGLWPDVWT